MKTQTQNQTYSLPIQDKLAMLALFIMAFVVGAIFFYALPERLH